MNSANWRSVAQDPLHETQPHNVHFTDCNYASIGARVPKPVPLQETQPRNVHFTDCNYASNGARVPMLNSKTHLQLPGRQNSAYGNQRPQRFNQQPPQWNSKAPTGKSRASEWNVNRPEVLFNDHSQYLLKHQFKRGMVINAPVHEALDARGKARGPSHYESISAWGSVLTKPRYLIVVALHETEYTCVPLYSHNHAGLRGKEHYRNEFVSVRDGRIRENFTALSDHRPLVTELATGPILTADSCALLTHTVSRGYKLNLCVCGQLQEESLGRLAGYLEAHVRKGLGLA